MSSLRWNSLAEFCADCPFQATCARSTWTEVTACPIVMDQVRADRSQAKPRLRRKLERPAGMQWVREPFLVIDPEDIIRHPGLAKGVKVAARISEVHAHKETK